MNADEFTDRVHKVVPYSLSTIEALRSCWRIPYSYIHALGEAPEVSMTFTPILSNRRLKGEFILVVFPSQDFQPVGII